MTVAIKERSSECRVIAFEPFVGNIPLFKQQTANLRKVSLIEAAVSDHAGTKAFYCNAIREHTDHLPGYSSIGYLIREGMARDPGKTTKVKVVSVDQTVSEHILFMKVDVQGGEVEVLKGAERTIERHGVDMIYVEYDDDPKVLNFLEKHGYLLYDSEYLYYGTDDSWAEKFMTNAEALKLTTGAKAYRGHVRSDIPRDLEGYANWMHHQPGLQTDILAVHQSFFSKFEKALSVVQDTTSS